jgi:Golgi SNAP receptor complex protein 1
MSQRHGMATYDSLHRQCRTLESLFDSKLTSYARLASAIVKDQDDDVESSGSRERWRDLQSEVEDLLEKVNSDQPKQPSWLTRTKLKETNDALLALSTNPDSIPSQSVVRAIQRHREVYQDYVREFQRTKVSINAPSPSYFELTRSIPGKYTACSRTSELIDWSTK